MRQKGWQINKVIKHGFFPHNQGLTSPTPYPLEPCPFHSTLHCRSWLWFILIDVRVYMMPNYNVPYSTAYHRQLSPFPKHTQQNRWWGFCLELLTTINYNIYIMQTGSKPGTLHLTNARIYHMICIIGWLKFELWISDLRNCWQLLVTVGLHKLVFGWLKLRF